MVARQNPAANRIYEAIGYRRVAESKMIALAC
jgi:predicted GNAT family acetyltransferase